MISTIAGNGNPTQAGTLTPEDIALLRSAEASARRRMIRRTRGTTPTVQHIREIVLAAVVRILARRRRLRGAA